MFDSDVMQPGTVMGKWYWATLLLMLFTLLPVSHTGFASTNLHIAMIVWRGETEAEQGFKDELQALGYTVQYTIVNAGQDEKALGRLLQRDIVPNLRNFDYIYTFGTTVSENQGGDQKSSLPGLQCGDRSRWSGYR
jgi:hypothetical protein